MLTPGPAFDARIATTLMGVCVHDDQVFREETGYVYRCTKCPSWGHGLARPGGSVPAYSTDITAAWAVLENTRLGGAYISVGPTNAGKWRASREKALNPRGDGTADDYDETYPVYTVEADTAPMAICVAALSLFLADGELEPFEVNLLDV